MKRPALRTLAAPVALVTPQSDPAQALPARDLPTTPFEFFAPRQTPEPFTAKPLDPIDLTGFVSRADLDRAAAQVEAITRAALAGAERDRLEAERLARQAIHNEQAVQALMAMLPLLDLGPSPQEQAEQAALLLPFILESA